MVNLSEKSNSTSYFLCGKAKDSRMSFLMSFVPSLYHTKRPKYNRALLMSLLCFPRANSVGNTFSFSINNPLYPTKIHSWEASETSFQKCSKEAAPIKRRSPTSSDKGFSSWSCQPQTKGGLNYKAWANQEQWHIHKEAITRMFSSCTFYEKFNKISFMKEMNLCKTFCDLNSNQKS